MSTKKIVRLPNGRFGPGTNVGGRPKKEATNYREIFQQALTPECVFQIIEKAIQQAKEGDRAARSWLLSYVCVPLPKTLKIEDQTQTESRQVIDQAVDNLPPDEFEALSRIVAKIEPKHE